MNAWPTSGPVRARSSHQAREANSSCHSRETRAILREREEHLLDTHARRIGHPGPLAKLGKRPLAGHAPIGEQHEAIAGAAGIGELVNGKEKRAPPGRLTAQD